MASDREYAQTDLDIIIPEKDTKVKNQLKRIYAESTTNSASIGTSCLSTTEYRCW